jgi:hypothetical protein
MNQKTFNPAEVIEIGFKSGYVKEMPFINEKQRNDCFKDMSVAMSFEVPSFELDGITINMQDVDYIQKADYV